MKNFYEAVIFSCGYYEDVEETFDTFEEAEEYCRKNDQCMSDEEGYFIRCHEDGKVWDEPWE